MSRRSLSTRLALTGLTALAVLTTAASTLVAAPAALGEPGIPATPYVALGDSYTASPLTGPLAGPPPGCLRSTNNYPHLVAASLGAALTDVSCSGARTRDFAAPQAVGGGSNPAQYAALSPATRLVTVGIGGNDIGFGEIVERCVSPTPFGTPCRDRYRGTIEPRIDALRPTLERVLAQVHAKAPAARVLLVGYPAILPTTGPGCYPVVPYTAGDVAYLRTVLTRLDDVIRSAAGAEHATYVDTYAATTGHDVCRPPGVKWIEGLLPTAPAAPVHPNAQGAAAESRAVLATLGRSVAAS